MNIRRLLKGQTILETTLAAALISVAIVAALALSTNTEKEASYSRDLNVATRYNYQAIDWIKQVKAEIGWSTLLAKIESDGSGSLYCLNTIPASPDDFVTIDKTTKDDCSSTFVDDKNRFYRTVTIVLDGTTGITVKADTYWQNNKEFSVSAETVITNY